MQRRHLAAPLSALLIAIIGAACGGSGTVGATATRSPIAAPATPAPPAGLAWTVTDKSKVTVRVREQLASLNFPSDAVLVATGAQGGFTLNPNATFSADSKVTFNVDSLASDSSQRDGFVKRTVLGTSQFPLASFVPMKVIGLTLPLPASGTFTFTLAGKLTIHGVEKDVTFTVQATRAGADLTATATLDPTIKFGDFGMPVPAAPGRVLSVVDEIKLVIDLVATGPKG
jgi:polyisoprenoid-binding protein YceI